MPSIGSLCVGSFYSFIFLCYNHSPEKWHFLALKSLLLPQFSIYRHWTLFIVKRNEQSPITNYLVIILPIGAYYQLSRFAYKFVIIYLQIFKVCYFAKKLLTFQKIPYNFFFFKRRYLGICMYYYYYYY